MSKINKNKQIIRIQGGSAALVLLLIAATFLTGCNGVRRRLTITSVPEGATVWLNDQEIGQTPISQNITWSGKYKIRLAKEGMETKTVMHEVRTPWYLWPGVDFVSENLVPGELRDNQSCHITMEGKRVIPDNELFESAAQMRSEAHDQANLRHYQGAAATESNGVPSNSAPEAAPAVTSVSNGASLFTTPNLAEAPIKESGRADEPVSQVQYVAPQQ